MPDPTLPLRQLAKDKPLLVGIDSDGCAFDTMEIKQKECFVPNIIRYWNLQPIAKYVRETVEFVNLYSKWRGVNRWPALLRVFDLLREREEVKARGIVLPNVGPLHDWVQRETKLSNASLEAEVERTGDCVLAKALAWSTKVNADIAELVHDIPPFPWVRESLEKVAAVADIVVVSQTPGEALIREWQEHSIDRFAKVIAGQEMGSKSQHLAYAMEGRYGSHEVLMIGDALGDLKAATDNGARFYPINPGHEEASWRRFHDEAFDRFVSGSFEGQYESELIAEFGRYLPEVAPWNL